MSHIHIPFEFAGKPEGMEVDVIEESTHSASTKKVTITISFEDAVDVDDLEEESFNDVLADIFKIPTALRKAVAELQETDELRDFKPDDGALMTIEVEGFDKSPNVTMDGRNLREWRQLSGSSINETFQVY